MIVITGKLDELFVRWRSTQSLPPPPLLLARFAGIRRRRGIIINFLHGGSKNPLVNCL